MAATPKYMFVIKDSSGNLYEFERCVNRAWEYYENDVGRCRFFVPYNDLKLSVTSIPDNKVSRIYIYRNESLVWQGLTQIVQDTLDGVWVFGETYEAALGWYGVRYNQAYTSTAIGTIITNEYDNIESRSNNFLSSLITQGTIEAPYISGTTSNLTITRTLFNENFLDFLKQMVLSARAEMTSTWSQNTVFKVSFSETTPTFTFTRNVGSDKADVILELDSEIIDFNIPRDMRSIVNEVKGLAITEGPSVITATFSDSTSAGDWYRREFYPFFNNVTAQSDLNQRASNFMQDRKAPLRDMKIKLASGLTPFDGYSMSDNIKVRINRGRVDIDEFRRVVGMEVTIDDTGIETAVPILQKART